MPKETIIAYDSAPNIKMVRDAADTLGFGSIPAAQQGAQKFFGKGVALKTFKITTTIEEVCLDGVENVEPVEASVERIRVIPRVRVLITQS